MKDYDWKLLGGFAAAKLAIHLGTFTGYGYFRDEFYYLACSGRLAFGYVDHPPLSIFLLWVQRALFGDSLFGLRLFPALAGAATILVVGLTARQMGGGRWAQAFAMTAAIAAPTYLALNHFYSMNAYDVLFWALAAWLLTKIFSEDRLSDWLWLGVVLGLGLLNKISVLWLGVGLAAGLLLTRRRRMLATPGPWVAAGIAFLIFAPHLIWQAVNGWPTVEFISNATSNKMAVKSVADFAVGQILAVNPISLPIWLCGLIFLLVGRKGEPHRVLGWIYVVVFVLLALSGTARRGYLAPAYTWLFPAGAVFLSEWVGSARARGAALAVVAIAGLLLAPFALPLLAPDDYVRYSRWTGVNPGTEERKELGRLPQFFADMHGWREVVAALREAYDKLEPREKEQAAILAPNYGVAGAVEFFAPDLPAPLSGHNNYWLWGPRGHTGEVMIVAGNDRETLLRHFRSVELGSTTDCGLCMPYENRRPVWICRGPIHPLAAVWPRLKHYD